MKGRLVCVTRRSDDAGMVITRGVLLAKGDVLMDISLPGRES